MIHGTFHSTVASQKLGQIQNRISIERQRQSIEGLIDELFCHTTADFQAIWYGAGAHAMSRGVAQETCSRRDSSPRSASKEASVVDNQTTVR